MQQQPYSTAEQPVYTGESQNTIQSHTAAPLQAQPAAPLRTPYQDVTRQSGTGVESAAAPPTSSSAATAVPSSRDVNILWLCRYGQELVEDIVAKTHEIFQMLKSMQLPNGDTVRTQQAQEKLVKLKNDQLKQTVSQYFRKLRAVYDKCNGEQVDFRDIETLVPVKEIGEVGPGDRPSSDQIKYQSKEYTDVAAQLTQRNQQIKEIIDYLRNIIWEVNTMLATRKDMR